MNATPSQYPEASAAGDVTITRGSDLTEVDLALIADDVCDVMWWCMRERIKRPDQAVQVRKAIEARLGRRPLIITGKAA